MEAVTTVSFTIHRPTAGARLSGCLPTDKMHRRQQYSPFSISHFPKKFALFSQIFFSGMESIS